MNIFGRKKLPNLELGIPEAPERMDATRVRDMSDAEIDQIRAVTAHAERTWPTYVPELRIENGYLLEGHRVIAKLETTDVDVIYRVIASYRALRWLLLANRLLATEILSMEEDAMEQAVTVESVARPGADA